MDEVLHCSSFIHTMSTSHEIHASFSGQSQTLHKFAHRSTQLFHTHAEENKKRNVFAVYFTGDVVYLHGSINRTGVARRKRAKCQHTSP